MTRNEQLRAVSDLNARRVALPNQSIAIEQPLEVFTTTTSMEFDLKKLPEQLHLMAMAHTDGFRNFVAFADPGVELQPFEVNPSNKPFPNSVTIKFRFSAPSRNVVSIKLARTGKVHIAGATTNEDIDRVEEFCKKAFMYVMSLNEPPAVKSFKIIMISARTSIDKCIHLPTAFAKVSMLEHMNSSLERGVHAGLQVYVTKDKVNRPNEVGKAIIFSSGKIIFVGFKNPSHLAYMHAFAMLVVNDRYVHSSIGQKRGEESDGVGEVENHLKRMRMSEA